MKKSTNNLVTDMGDILTLPAIIDSLGKSSSYASAAVHALYNNTSALTQIDKLLANQHHLNSYILLSEGTSAIILLSSEDQVVRMAYDEEYKRPKIPHVLQALASHEIDGITIEILPKVPILSDAVWLSEITTKEAAKLQEMLTSAIRYYHQPHDFYDNGFYNIGLLPNGIPVVVDGGAVAEVITSTGFPTYYIQQFLWEGQQEKFFGDKVIPTPKSWKEKVFSNQSKASLHK